MNRIRLDIYQIRFENGGHTTEPLKVIDKCDENRTGTTVKFLPDDEIFTETTVYEFDILKQRLREMAFLTKGLRIVLIDKSPRTIFS